VNDKVEKDKSKFDWVTERSSCSLPNVFKKLRLQTEEDVKTRNVLRPNNSPYHLAAPGLRLCPLTQLFRTATRRRQSPPWRAHPRT
jgi:hypothetical protein